MCGIFFTCSRNGHREPDDATQHALRARGPDSLNTHYVRIKTTRPGGEDALISGIGYYLTFTSSVLSLRGHRVCIQPLIDPSTGSVLCWNGEAWKIDGAQVHGNDTEQIFALLLDASNGAVDDKTVPGKYPDRVASVLIRVAGPYAFVYYDATTSIVYYGRDRLGRRSLIVDNSEYSPAERLISSLSFKKPLPTEVTTNGVHYLDLSNPIPTSRCIPWPLASPSINKAAVEHSQYTASIPSPTAVMALQKHLSDSIRLRVADVPTFTANAESSSKSPSRVAILFSGGLDCTLLARLTHDVLPIDQPIDLLNVAFENPRTIRAAQQSMKSSNSTSPPISPFETCPDRVTGRSSFSELTSICPSRTWRFVAIDILYSETISHRPTIINLMAPHNTEMDLSITLALYFASRGHGRAITSLSSQPIPYTTTSRVLLSGLGADELFGGYARHAAAFNRAGYAGLNDELELDFTRIGTRNLGRDDRVIAHWGREIRYPFLDEDFVAFALGLSAWEKVGFRPDRVVPKHFEGYGERVSVEEEGDLDPAKMILRLAAWNLGMKCVAGEKKRAIQFGARTAKMEGGRTRGTDLLVPE